MKLTFLGGADEVGASSTLVEIGGKRLLIDAGIRISPKSSRGIENDQLPHLAPITDSGGPDYILVTHAHTDHTGALPLVVERYPHVPVILTRPTEALVRVLQADAQRIMKSKKDAEGELPLFDEVAVERLLESFQYVEFNQPLRLGEGLQVTYIPSGHIVGAAMLLLESAEGTLMMSGDLSLNDQRAVVSAELKNVKVDAMVMESTYGGRAHANRKAEEMRLIETLKRVTERGGKVLIPAFALGRAQEIMQIILAYRDELDAPVYADGMVRSVCDAYHTFSDVLPKNTVRAAKDDHLFFRNKIKPIRSRAMREQIANSEEPLVVVASSGMLTGGASVAYARAFAGDERNGIFLTGYQDEEAPGRYIQRALREQSEGQAVTIKLDGKPTTVRCELGTYSLSAHADEGELVSIAEHFDAKEIMLVHGDPSARHSLATRLRQRGRRVLLPKIAQTETFAFAPRPWALGVKSGKETKPLEPKALWEQLKSQAGDYFSAGEIAQMWWGDMKRAPEAKSMLEKDQLYFAADWRDKSTFQVHSAEQVARIQRRRAIMLANPDIVGKLVVLRNTNDQPRLGVVSSAGQDGFEAIVAGAKGRHQSGEALLWVIGDWEGYNAEPKQPVTNEDGTPKKKRSMKSQLSDLLKRGQSLKDTVMPLPQRVALVEKGEVVDPRKLVPDPLPEGVEPVEALVSVVLALAADGATVEEGGLKPQRAMKSGGPIEQNEARELAFAAFPAEARLRKVGMEVHRNRLTLNFDFPDVAQRVYTEQIEQVMDQTGWTVMIKPGVNQQALGEALEETLPDGAVVVKGPSFFMDRNEVGIDVEGVEDKKALAKAYFDMTGYKLLINAQGDGKATGAAVAASPGEKANQLEINAAYGLIRVALDEHGLNKTSLKNGQIVLAFISPQVGERHTEKIAELAQQTGYTISVHPHPNQQQILQIANRMLRETGWAVRKGPGIHVDRAEVAVTLANAPDEEEQLQVAAALRQQTGYALNVSLQG